MRNYIWKWTRHTLNMTKRPKILNRVRDHLAEWGKNQARLAEAIGMPAPRLSLKLREVPRKGEASVDRFSMPELFDVAEVLGVPAWKLIAGSEKAELTSDQEAVLRAYDALDDNHKLAFLTDLVNRRNPQAGNDDVAPGRDYSK